MDLHPDRKPHPVVSSLWPLAPRDSVVSSRLLGVGLLLLLGSPRDV